MSEYDNNNRGAGWKEANPESERHPIIKGSAMIDGKDYWVSIFRNRNDHPKSPDIDMVFKAKDAQVEKPKQKSENVEQFGEDIPF